MPKISILIATLYPTQLICFLVNLLCCIRSIICFCGFPGDPLVRGSEPLMRGSGSSGGSDSDYNSVEDATINLMRQCCHNHPHNQSLLASTLCHLIQRQNIPPPGMPTFVMLILSNLNSFRVKDSQVMEDLCRR